MFTLLLLVATAFATVPKESKLQKMLMKLEGSTEGSTTSGSNNIPQEDPAFTGKQYLVESVDFAESYYYKTGVCATLGDYIGKFYGHNAEYFKYVKYSGEKCTGDEETFFISLQDDDFLGLKYADAIEGYTSYEEKFYGKDCTDSKGFFKVLLAGCYKLSSERYHKWVIENNQVDSKYYTDAECKTEYVDPEDDGEVVERQKCGTCQNNAEGTSSSQLTCASNSPSEGGDSQPQEDPAFKDKKYVRDVKSEEGVLYYKKLGVCLYNGEGQSKKWTGFNQTHYRNIIYENSDCDGKGKETSFVSLEEADEKYADKIEDNYAFYSEDSDGSDCQKSDGEITVYLEGCHEFEELYMKFYVEDGYGNMKVYTDKECTKEMEPVQHMKEECDKCNIYTYDEGGYEVTTSAFVTCATDASSMTFIMMIVALLFFIF